MMRAPHVILSGSCLALALLASDADARLARAGDASVSFTATGPGGLKIVGTTSELAVADDAQTVTITVPLKNVDTKIDLRNKHMREKYLEVDKYPSAVLTVPRGEIKMPSGAEIAGEASGTMKIHGREKAVRFRYSAKRAGDKLAVVGNVRLDIKDFAIEEPSFMGATVKRDVDVSASFQVTGD